MAISYVGQATGTTTATMPAHVAGDLILCFAYNRTGSSAPTLPAGWTTNNSANNDTVGTNYRCGRKIAASSSETVGTWTNATDVVVLVYRGTDQTTPVETSGFGTYWGTNKSNSATTTVAYGSFSVLNTGAWGVCFSGITTGNTNLQTAPSGMVNRANRVATGEVAAFDTNSTLTAGGAGSFNPGSVSVGGTAGIYRTLTLQILPVLPKILAANGATYALTGGDAGLLLKLLNKMPADGASIVLAGQGADFIRRKLVADGRTFALGTNDPATITANFSGLPMKVRISGAWQPGRLKIFDGTNWVKPRVKMRVGGSWVVVS